MQKPESGFLGFCILQTCEDNQGLCADSTHLDILNYNSLLFYGSSQDFEFFDPK